ncbi:hypothetical protein HN51_062079 [Arachis hypogaea]
MLKPGVRRVSLLLLMWFNLSFQESIDDNDDSDEGKDEDGRPYFFEIERSDSFLDKELAASGFIKKDKEDIQRFIEGGAEAETNLDSEVDSVEDLNESILLQDEEHENKEKYESCEVAESSASKREDATNERLLAVIDELEAL